MLNYKIFFFKKRRWIISGRNLDFYQLWTHGLRQIHKIGCYNIDAGSSKTNTERKNLPRFRNRRSLTRWPCYQTILIFILQFTIPNGKIFIRSTKVNRFNLLSVFPMFGICWTRIENGQTSESTLQILHKRNENLGLQSAAQGEF